MDELGVSNARACDIVKDITRHISCHHLLGSVGQHRGVYITARSSRLYLSFFCRFVRKAVRAKGLRDIQIVPLDLAIDDYESALKINGWKGIVAISLDSYFDEYDSKSKSLEN